MTGLRDIDITIIYTMEQVIRIRMRHLDLHKQESINSKTKVTECHQLIPFSLNEVVMYKFIRNTTQPDGQPSNQVQKMEDYTGKAIVVEVIKQEEH